MECQIFGGSGVTVCSVRSLVGLVSEYEVSDIWWERCKSMKCQIFGGSGVTV